MMTRDRIEDWRDNLVVCFPTAQYTDRLRTRLSTIDKVLNNNLTEKDVLNEIHHLKKELSNGVSFILEESYLRQIETYEIILNDGYMSVPSLS